MSNTLFITGTDTGVGKTLLTALLLNHLRDEGHDAIALKPFCSGTREDAELLHSLQKTAISLEETNPFYFPKPLAPWVAAKKGGQIAQKTVLEQINRQKKRHRIVLIEGSGGILVPLGDSYTVADLIQKLACPTIVVGKNRLGTINHTLLTIKYLQTAGIKNITVVLMNEETPDLSAKTNPKSLQLLLSEVPVFEFPFLGKKASCAGEIKKHQKKMKKTLARVLGHANLITF